MAEHAFERHELVRKLQHGDGSPFLVYHTSAIGDPPDHVAGKWYHRLYPGRLEVEPRGPFESAGEAERAARAEHAGSDGSPGRDQA
jgi:hypothetical protein